MAAAFSYQRTPPPRHLTSFPSFSRGVPVLRWACASICEDKELVQFLVWSNPCNLCWASPALQSDVDVVRTALLSPYYWQAHPETGFCVLRYAAEEMREVRPLVLDAIAQNAYELQFVGEGLRADPYVVAWAGAPKGAIADMACGKELVRFIKTLPASGLTVEHVEAHAEEVFDGYAKHVQDPCFGRGRKPSMAETWKQFEMRGPENAAAQKEEWCRSVQASLEKKMPLFFSVSPAIREVLWPTRE